MKLGTSKNKKSKAMLHASCFRFQERGFTIIEMLVVLAITSLLLALAVNMFSGIKTRGRDSSREESIKEIQNALNLYVVNNHLYPVCLVKTVIDGGTDCLSQALISGKYFATTPTDPLRGDVGACGTPGDYVYCYQSTDGLSYTLEYALETNTILGKSAGWQIVTVFP